MALVGQSEALPEESPPRAPTFVARIGTLYMPVKGKGDDKALFDGLVEALARDPRVKSLTALTYEEANPSRLAVIAAAGTESAGRSGALPSVPQRHKHIFRTRRPLTFSVSAPVRLQAGSGREDAVPTETYWASWDGEVVVILWRFPSDRNPVGARGGLVVLDVLKKALEKLEADCMAQPCGPNCSYPFAHTDLILRPKEGVKNPSYEKVSPYVVKSAYDATITDPEALLRTVYQGLRWTVHSFGVMRSEGRALAELEQQARMTLTSLLGLYYQRSHATSAPNLLRFWMKESRHGARERWKMRGWRQRSARLVDTMWLLLSTIEAKRYDWHKARFMYDDTNTQDGGVVMFGVEYGQEVNAVEGLDVTGLRAATEQGSARLDNRAIANATVAGAMAGGVVAATATVIQLLTS